jgi:hypothetical protein
MTNGLVIETERLGKSYGRLEAVKELNLSIQTSLHHGISWSERRGQEHHNVRGRLGLPRSPWPFRLAEHA